MTLSARHLLSGTSARFQLFRPGSAGAPDRDVRQVAYNLRVVDIVRVGGVVSDRVGPDPLSATRHFVLVLRLVLGPSDRDLYGDILDPETGEDHAFVGLAGLSAVVGKWLRKTDRRMDQQGDHQVPESKGS
jgi:hypothetical protein